MHEGQKGQRAAMADAALLGWEIGKAEMQLWAFGIGQ